MMLVEGQWGYTITTIKVRSALGRGILLVARQDQHRIMSRSCRHRIYPIRRLQASRRNSSILRSRCRPHPRHISPKHTTIRLHSSSSSDQTCIVKTLTIPTGRLITTFSPGQSFLPSSHRLIPSHSSSGFPATSSSLTYNSSFNTCSPSCLFSIDKYSSMRRSTPTPAP